MKRPELTRRQLIKQAWTVFGSALLTLPLEAQQSRSRAAGPLRVTCVGGHPDDPESGCAGTLARYAESGHRVTIVYLTRGERGIAGKSNEEAAAIRTAECEEACRILGVRAVYAGQMDGSADFTRGRVDEMEKLLFVENPEVVFTHWPMDTHMDHQAASLCTMRACLALKARPQLYLFEVNTGSQTFGFSPNTYVDITGTLEKKKAALVAHKSQNGEGIWKNHHEVIASWRGREAGLKAAEAFFHVNRDHSVAELPGL
jgi:LmbE family N-acetylglucosaminyl deacetylase